MALTHEVHISASMLEIYNESIQDLLDPSNSEKLDIKLVSPRPHISFNEASTLQFLKPLTNLLAQ